MPCGFCLGRRWKEPIVRKQYPVGSFHKNFAVTINPTDGNDWTWAIPERESDYNADVK